MSNQFDIESDYKEERTHETYARAPQRIIYVALLRGLRLCIENPLYIVSCRVCDCICIDRQRFKFRNTLYIYIYITTPTDTYQTKCSRFEFNYINYEYYLEALLRIYNGLGHKSIIIHLQIEPHDVVVVDVVVVAVAAAIPINCFWICCCAANPFVITQTKNACFVSHRIQYGLYIYIYICYQHCARCKI